MERVISGLPWLPRDKYHVAVHEPTPRGTFVRVSFRKGACVCGDLQGRYAEACRWVKADESVDDALNDISAWVGETHGSCGGNALMTAKHPLGRCIARAHRTVPPRTGLGIPSAGLGSPWRRRPPPALAGVAGDRR